MKYFMRINIISIALFLSFFANAQQTINESIMVNGVNRDYIVYVPASYNESSFTPLMLNFHGYTLSANHQMTLGGDMRFVADTAGFILVYPQGTLLNGNTHWNVGSWTTGSMADDLGFTEAMIDALSADYNVDLNRVYSCGYSNGGYFSFELACNLSDRIAAVGSVAGVMSDRTYNACNPSHYTPVITIHGTVDGLVGYDGTYPSESKSAEETINYWLNHNDLISPATAVDLADINSSDDSTIEYHLYNDDNACVSVAHYKVLGGDHDWPGLAGNMDIHASAVIWNFVSNYDLNGLIDCSPVLSAGMINEINDLQIYPNPVLNTITLKTDLEGELNYQIYSMVGNLILSGFVNSSSRTIDLSGLPPNIYLLKSGTSTFKVIKLD